MTQAPTPPILILTEAELRAAVPLDLAAVDATEAAFAALARPGARMPPVLSMDLPEANGEVDVKTAFLPGFDAFAIKVSPGFFDNPRLGLPSLNGLMCVFSAKTGLVEAVLLDNGYLTNIRTAAAGAVAARWLAPERVETAAVLGAGVQARMQMIAAHLVRPFARGWVWARDPARAAEAAAEIASATGADIRVAATPQEAVSASQIVITATPSTTPVLQAGWLAPGRHVTAMGSDQHGKNEIAPEALAAADLYVCDRVSQAAAMGELRAAREAGYLPGPPPELGEIVAGLRSGRLTEAAVTICDLTGTGAQDTAIAAHALAAARAAGAGMALPR
ncbi:ornithine cyclodeaminase [Albimonas donghaensis]|uniref:Ornithine cyclodeaminase n=1 Tax=Albimonas donghaensis TaxID=356660 RepID=A0A1H3CJN0_9RHOB|nr:cyclodeaminase [Albimonas donghaensis]SDX54286.1 ornithine cyclodeaminase [Albimonas donghaensis]